MSKVSCEEANKEIKGNRFELVNEIKKQIDRRARLGESLGYYSIILNFPP